MNKPLTTLASLAAAMMFASLSVHATDKVEKAAPGPIAKGEGPAQTVKPHAKDRADVKAEAAMAVKDGKVRKGEGSAKVADPHAGASTAAEDKAEAKMRTQVKAEAAAAVKAGDVAKGPNVPATGGVAKTKP